MGVEIGRLGCWIESNLSGITSALIRRFGFWVLSGFPLPLLTDLEYQLHFEPSKASSRRIDPLDFQALVQDPAHGVDGVVPHYPRVGIVGEPSAEALVG